MSHFIDVQISIDPEFTVNQLLAALYAKLHRVLSQQRITTIGVAFPGYNGRAPHLGRCLRLFGPADDLLRLMAQNWLTGLRDHVTVSEVTTIPVNITHRTLRRVQAKSSPERLRRRLVRRHSITEKQAYEQIPDTAAERLQLPFIKLKSSSNGRTFYLYLRLGEPLPEMIAGSFNAYGLSSDATVPWF